LRNGAAFEPMICSKAWFSSTTTMRWLGRAVRGRSGWVAASTEGVDLPDEDGASGGLPSARADAQLASPATTTTVKTAAIRLVVTWQLTVMTP
jgi:hypothetical protein